MDWFEEAKRLKDEEGLELKEIAQRVNKTYDTVRKEFAHFRKYSKNNIVYEDKKPIPTDEDIEQYYIALKNVNNAMDNLDTKQTKMTITINDDKPIGLAFWGDQHNGSRGIDYEQLDKDKESIIETDGLYYIGMGDYKENQNALIHANGVNEQIASPGMQDYLVMKIIRETKEKALALIRGCHDDWDKRVGDKDFISTLCEIADCVNLWHGGGININLGSQTYKIRARHKFKGESEINTTNAQRRLLQAFGPADVIAIAHKHFPDMQVLEQMEQQVIYIRSGSYKIYDEFGQKIGGYKGKVGVPVVVIFPNEKKLVPFRNLEDGISYLKSVRGAII